MRILADENFPGEAVEALRSRGHDVAWVRSDAPGSRDEDIIQRTMREARLLLTFDKDFGPLAFRSGMGAPSGVVLFRISMSSPTRVARTAVDILESRADWSGNFSVVEDERVRMSPLPLSGQRA